MDKIKKIARSPLFCIFISAVLSALPHICDKLYFLPFISFIPYIGAVIYFSQRGEMKKCFWGGMLFGSIYFLISYSFFLSMYPIANMGIPKYLQILIVLLGWIVSSAIHSLLFSIAPLAVYSANKFISRRKYALSLIFSFFFIICEKMCEYTELAFPWLRISLGLFRCPILIQSAAVFGSLGIDIIILLINSLIYLFISSERKEKIICLVFAIGLLFSDIAYGAFRMNEKNAPEKKIKAAIVQESIGVYESDESEISEAKREYFGAVEKLSYSDADIIILPETAIPTSFGNIENEIKELSAECGKAIYIGILGRNDSGVPQNAAVLVQNENISEKYVKKHLAPFGEFLPYKEIFNAIFPFLSELNELAGDMEKGCESTVIESEFGRIGSVICFDSVFADSYSDMVSAGSDVIFVITNDAWYKNSAELEQHLAHSVMRSIECSRYVVRGANSGISAIIDSRGRIINESEKLEKKVIIGEYALNDEITFYQKTGDIIIIGTLIAVIAVCIYESLRKGDEANGRKK